ncbi:hypothetical protein CUMW_222480, partial [Citrus unshiu]
CSGSLELSGLVRILSILKENTDTFLVIGKRIGVALNMECNKDEAIKAKQVAENKIRTGDFAGALRFAHKAQRLYPELDNVSQILTVCEVHCSAQNQTLGSEKDWYGILQIERSADEATIKKQYRKLALLLHPDKNKFAGAEAAFKLIGEAHRVLSDSTRRSTYDLKCRTTVRSSAPKTQPQSAQWNSFVKKQNGPASSFPRGPLQSGAANTVPKTPSQFTGSHPIENAQTTAFWTSCSNCGMRYQYYRTFVNKVLRCQNCQQCFTAFDLGTQGMPPGFPWHQFHSYNGVPNPAMQNGFPNPGPSKVASQNNCGKPSGRNFFKRFDPVSNAGNASQAGGSSKTQEKVGGRANLKEDAGMPKPNLANGMESGRTPKPNVVGTSRNSTRKRKRKSVIESDESSEEVDVEVQEKDSNFSSQNFAPDAGQQLRRSSRQRQNILYNENINDGDFFSSPKRSKGSKPDRSGEEELQEAGDHGGVSKYGTSSERELKQKASSIEESMPNKKSNTREHKAEGKEADISACDNGSTRNPEIIEYPDPDFNDFDKIREENCFAVNQTWAIYDPCDGMPRFHARIKKVFSPHFRLQITWLEPNPDDESEKAWCDVELPIGCGKFINGKTEDTEDRLMFSHQKSSIRSVGRRSFLIYPKVGETWAIFSDWDIKWGSDPEKHRPPYQYEFVEVLTDFDENVGIGVAYLGKVNGFVSLFKQTAHHGVISFSIAPAHMYKFSHQIPSYKMTGKEREGVPVGSFEFDPASLPTSVNKLDDPDDVQMEKENLVSKSSGLSPASAKGKEKPTMDSKKTSLPKRPDSDPEGEHLMPGRSATGSNRGMPNCNQVDAGQCINDKGCSEADERIKTCKKQTIVCAIDALRLRRSPRDLGKKKDQLNVSQCEVREEVYKHSDAKKIKKQSSILHFMGSVSSSHYNEKMHLHKKGGSSTSVKESYNAPSSPSTVHKIADAVCYDFKAERSEDKFEFGQIWALYSDVDGMPRNYAQVKRIETSDFRLHVVPLEACSPSNALNQPVCCGTFIVNGKTKVIERSAFSHQVKADAIGENRFEIYPRKGQVWAVYKKGNSELSVSDWLKHERDIVEILEDREQNIKVAILSSVNGYKSVYRIPRSQRSKTRFVDIPQADLSRFSHQIPAFHFTREKSYQLSGCWNLDPLAIPGATSGGTIILD